MSDRATITPIISDEEHEGCVVVAMSDVGRVRTENEDFMGYVRRSGGQMLVVADGMGGHSGGYEASRITVDQFRAQFLASEAEQDPAEVMSAAVIAANSSVRAVADSNSALKGLGTTVVAAIVRNGEAWISHVGDSRAYLIRDGSVELLTQDHSRINRMIAEGLIKPSQAANHPMGHILERSVGCAEVVEADVRTETVTLRPHDRLMLCSDGYWGLMTDEDIARQFALSDLKSAVEMAIGAALARGADDNTTIGVLEFGGPTPASGPFVGRDTIPITGRAVGEGVSGAALSRASDGASQADSTAGPSRRAVVVIAVVLLVVGAILGKVMFSGGNDEADEGVGSAGEDVAEESPKATAEPDPAAAKGEAERTAKGGEAPPAAGGAPPKAAVGAQSGAAAGTGVSDPQSTPQFAPEPSSRAGEPDAVQDTTPAPPKPSRSAVPKDEVEPPTNTTPDPSK